MAQYGNKLEVIRRLLEVVKYIEDSQNSPDLQAYKTMIMKMISTMINTTITVKEKNIVDEQVVEDVKDFCGNCTDQSCSTVTPQYNIQDTIEKIKTELGSV